MPWDVKRGVAPELPSLEPPDRRILRYGQENQAEPTGEDDEQKKGAHSGASVIWDLRLVASSLLFTSIPP